MNAPARLCDLRCTHPECAQFRAQVAVTLRDVFGIERLTDERGKGVQYASECVRTCQDCGREYESSTKDRGKRCVPCADLHHKQRKAANRRRRTIAEFLKRQKERACQPSVSPK